MFTTGQPDFLEASMQSGVAADPRLLVAQRTPGWMQGFMTWLMAKPAPDQAPRERSPTHYVVKALVLTLGGIALSAAGMSGVALPLACLLLLVGAITTSSGLGLFQVVVFHHCSHMTVFRRREHNVLVGRLVSSLLLFKSFDEYRAEHMVHHSANKLFTDEDEFTDFVLGICDLAPTATHRQLWRKLLTDLVSPVWHARFMWRRVSASVAGPIPFRLLGPVFWTALFAGAWACHLLGVLLVAVVLPLSVLLQVATVFRILCEHRFPAQAVIERRGKEFICLATAGVFPGSAPPAAPAGTWRGTAAWALWWADMLTVQLFARVFVLVGDAPAHDFHHRRPATKRWPSYIHARQQDEAAGCPGFPVNYQETWGLFRAVDENLASMARTPVELIGARTLARAA